MCSAGTTKITTSHATNVKDSDVPLLRGTHLVATIPLGAGMVDMVQMVDKDEFKGNRMELQMLHQEGFKINELYTIRMLIQ